MWSTLVPSLVHFSLHRASSRNRAFCLSTAQESTTISGEPCPTKSASFAHLAAPERAVRSELLPRCCTLCHVPDGLKRFPAYLNRWDSQQARNEGVFAH